MSTKLELSTRISIKFELIRLEDRLSVVVVVVDFADVVDDVGGGVGSGDSDAGWLVVAAATLKAPLFIPLLTLMRPHYSV